MIMSKENFVFDLSLGSQDTSGSSLEESGYFDICKNGSGYTVGGLVHIEKSSADDLSPSYSPTSAPPSSNLPTVAEPKVSNPILTHGL